MADAFEVQIANAVVAELNDAARSWQTPTPQFTAARSWAPIYTPELLKTLQTAVVPMLLDEEKLNRAPLERCDYKAAIDFQQAVDTSTAAGNAAIDVLTKLVQDVHDFYRNAHKLATLPAATVMMARREMLYDLELLYSQGTFESAIELTVRLYR